MAKKAAEEKINLDAILFKCRDILRQARNSGSFFEKRDMMLTLVFLRFIGEKIEDGVANLRKDLETKGLTRTIRISRPPFWTTPRLPTAPIICSRKPAGPPSSIRLRRG